MSGHVRSVTNLNRRHDSTPLPACRPMGGAPRCAVPRATSRCGSVRPFPSAGAFSLVLLVAAIVACAFAVGAAPTVARAAAAGETHVTLAVDGQAPVEVAASLKAGTVYLPAEGVARALGVQSSAVDDGTVRWTLADRHVTIDWRAGTVQYGHDGRRETITPTPRPAEDGVYVPVAFVAELFDLKIQWEPSLGTLALIPRDGFPRLRDPGGAAPDGGRRVGGAGTQRAAPPSRTSGDSAVSPSPGGVEGGQGEDDVLRWRGPQAAAGGDETWARRLALDVLNLSPVHSIRVGNVDGRSVLEIGVRGDSSAEVALLTDPARLMIDLDGALLDTEVVEDVNDGPVRRMRAAQTSLDTARVVLDLAHPVGYGLARADDGDGWVVVLQNELSDVAVRREDGRVKLYVKTSSAPDYETTLLRDPLRLVVDFKDSTFVGGRSDANVGDPLVRAVRVSQFTSDIVRVVLDLENEARPVEVPFIPAALNWDDSEGGADGDLPGGGGRDVPDIGDPSNWQSALAFELLAPLREIALRSSDETAELTLVSPGGVKPQLFYEREPTRLIIDVPGVFLTPGDDESVGELAKRLESAGGGLVRGVDVEAHVGGTEHKVRLSLLTDGLQPYDVTATEDGRRAVVRIGKPDRPRHVVVIDPGHGGVDPGAVGPDGAMEKDYVLDIAKRLEKLLTEAGIGAVLTRTDDYIVDLAERPAIAERHGADLFVSVHINSAVNEAPSGTETLYSPVLPENRQLALIMQRELVRVLGTVNRGLHERPELAVLRRAVMPAVLVEVAFIQNPFDGEQLKRSDFRQRAAAGLFNGVLAFLGDGDDGQREEAAR